MDDHTDLIGRATGGDEEALESLLARHSPVLRGRLQGRIAPHWRSMIEVDDVLQVTYLEAFLRIRSYQDRGEASFLAWLTRIADNNLRDAIRGLERAKRPDPRRRVVSPGSDESYVGLVEVLGMTLTTPSMNAARGEMVAELERMLSRLPADYERVIRMYDLEGRGIEEVASELGRSSGAIYMLRARAHERLAGLLGSESRFFSRRS